MKIQNCARCGGDHENIEPIKFDRAFAPPEARGVEWTHFAMCPRYAQPILISYGKHGDLPDGIGLVNGTDYFENALDVCYDIFVSRAETFGGDTPNRDAFKSVLREFYAKWGTP